MITNLTTYGRTEKRDTPRKAGEAMPPEPPPAGNRQLGDRHPLPQQGDGVQVQPRNEKAMTQEEAMEKPLHEVYRAFQSVINLPKWAPKTKTDRQILLSRKEEQVMLREVLLERCQNIGYDNDPMFPAFIGMSLSGNKAAISMSRPAQLNLRDVIADAALLKDIGAAANFMAWELEQREKEAGK